MKSQSFSNDNDDVQRTIARSTSINPPNQQQQQQQHSRFNCLNERPMCNEKWLNNTPVSVGECAGALGQVKLFTFLRTPEPIEPLVSLSLHIPPKK